MRARRWPPNGATLAICQRTPLSGSERLSLDEPGRASICASVAVKNVKRSPVADLGSAAETVAPPVSPLSENRVAVRDTAQRHGCPQSGHLATGVRAGRRSTPGGRFRARGLRATCSRLEPSGAAEARPWRGRDALVVAPSRSCSRRRRPRRACRPRAARERESAQPANERGPGATPGPLTAAGSA
jgi:hypothetical protein